MSVRVIYDHKLGVLRQDLKGMARMVESVIKQIFAAPEDQSYAMVEDVIRRDRTVSDMERTTKSRYLSLILRQQPMASDLHQVSTALKVVTSLERVRDHASDTAELILHIESGHTHHTMKHLPATVSATQNMIHDVIEASISQDLEEALKIVDGDNEIDMLFNKIKTDVIDLLKSSPDQADQGIDLLVAAKYPERVGGHAVNVCERTQFSKTGTLKNVRIT